MYKKDRKHQIAFTDFNQPFGMQMNPKNRWVVKATTIPWDKIDDKQELYFLLKLSVSSDV